MAEQRKYTSTAKLKNAPQKEKKYKVTDDTAWIVLAAVVVLVVLTFAFIFWQVNIDAHPAEIINVCNPGLCKFSTLSGIKTCPPNNTDQLRFQPGAEFCTSKNYCQWRNYTCAVQLDQTLNCAGVCGVGNEECRCIQDPSVQ